MMLLLDNLIFVLFMIITFGGVIGFLTCAGLENSDFSIKTRIIIGIIVACLFGGGASYGMLLSEQAEEKDWNNGKCLSCNIEWNFTNADHLRNGNVYYYFTCKECNKIIKTSHNYTE